MLQSIFKIAFIVLSLLAAIPSARASGGDPLPPRWQKDRTLYNTLSDAACAGDEGAFMKLKTAAEQAGSPQAMVGLRWVYLNDDCDQFMGVNDETRRLLVDAAKGGYPLAKALLGSQLLRGLAGRSKDVDRADELLNEAMSEGYPRAALILAWSYTDGTARKPNLDRAQMFAEYAMLHGVNPSETNDVMGRTYELERKWDKALAKYESSGSDYAKKQMKVVKANKEQVQKLFASVKNPPDSNASKLHFAALSISTDDGTFGWSHDYLDESEARLEAGRQCQEKGGARCQTKLLFEGPGCGFYIYAEGGTPYGWGVAPNEMNATYNARQECSTRNNNEACTGGWGQICNGKSGNRFKIVYEAENTSGRKK